MVLKESVLQKRAQKLELKGLVKINFNGSCLSALEELLHNIYVIGRPKPIDYHTRGDLIRVFNALAKEVYGGDEGCPVVEAFGSFSMDMFSNNSDLDLSVNFSDEAELSRDDKIKALRKLSKKLYGLQSKGHVFGVNPVLRARVPVLKVVDRGTRIECDISIGNKDGMLKSQLVFLISEIDERFQKLSSLMKAWAKAYGINSSKDQTLNSLSIILLVAFHLQTREPPILPPFSALLRDGTNPESVKKLVQDYLHFGKENKETIAQLFASLLSKLASVESLWPEGLCASTYQGSWISKTWNHKVGNISVEDITDRSQNVARAVCSGTVKTIYKCISSSLHHLSTFNEGKIESPKLKDLLFGPEPVPQAEKPKNNLKRSFPFNGSTASQAAKRKAGWNPWEDGNPSLVKVNNVISGFRPASVGFKEELGPEALSLQCPPPLPPLRHVGLQHPPLRPHPELISQHVGLRGPPLHPPPQHVGFNGAWHGPPGPMFLRPNGGGHWDSWPTHNQIPRPDVPFYPNGHGWAPPPRI